MEKFYPFELPSVRANKLNANFAEAGGEAGPVVVDDITDATAVGKSVMKAADAAAARTAIGAGTSNLAIGTTATTAKAGNYAPPVATVSANGLVKQGVAVADATEETLIAQFNALLASLRTAGVIAA